MGTGWTKDLPITAADRAVSVVGGDEIPLLSGGKAKAKLSRPSPHNDPAAIPISRIFRVLTVFFGLFIRHANAADKPANLLVV
jgi:hypothetical protein